MRKLAGLAALAVIVSAVSADASNVTFGIRDQALGTTGAVSVPSAGNRVFEITAIIDDGTATSDGLALWGSDLTFSGAGTIANLVGGVLADPTAAPMTSFDYPDGVTNPPHVANASGYRGTNNGTSLLQAGGGQNTIGNPGPTPPFPVGTVTEEVGVTIVVVATGTYNVQAGPSQTITLANCFANTIDNNEAGPTVYNVSAATTTCGASLTYSVVGVGGTIQSAVARKNCDIAIDIPPGGAITTESRTGGITQMVVTYTGGDPANNTIVVQQDTSCPTPPTYVAYAGASVPSCVITPNTLTCTFTPGLENVRTYRFTIASGAGTGQIELRGLVGDVNSDGFVNATDRSQVVAQWTAPGYSCATDASVDVNASGATDGTDRSLVVAAWTNPAANCAP